MSTPTSVELLAATGDCRACRAEIVWAMHPGSGKLAPLVPAPTPPPSGGTFTIESVAGKLVYHAGPGSPRYVSHFSDCPKATTFRTVRVREHERRVSPQAKREQIDDAVERSSSSASDEWKDAALLAAHDVALRGRPFTADDVWELLARREITEPPTRSAMGGVLRTLYRAGTIAPTGAWVQSSRASTHRRLQEWRPTTRES